MMFLKAHDVIFYQIQKKRDKNNWLFLHVLPIQDLSQYIQFFSYKYSIKSFDTACSQYTLPLAQSQEISIYIKMKKRQTVRKSLQNVSNTVIICHRGRKSQIKKKY